MYVLDQLLSTLDTVASRPVQPALGLYGIFADTPGCLPDIELPLTELVYVGRSTDLNQRNHFNTKRSGFHTFKRSIGAIMKAKLNLTAIPSAPGPSAANYRNFRFTEDGEERLTKWKRSNLPLRTRYPTGREAPDSRSRTAAEPDQLAEPAEAEGHGAAGAVPGRSSTVHKPTGDWP